MANAQNHGYKTCAIQLFICLDLNRLNENNFNVLFYSKGTFKWDFYFALSQRQKEKTFFLFLNILRIKDSRSIVYFSRKYVCFVVFSKRLSITNFFLLSFLMVIRYISWF